MHSMVGTLSDLSPPVCFKIDHCHSVFQLLLSSVGRWCKDSPCKDNEKFMTLKILDLWSSRIRPNIQLFTIVSNCKHCLQLANIVCWKFTMLVVIIKCLQLKHLMLKLNALNLIKFNASYNALSARSP